MYLPHTSKVYDLKACLLTPCFEMKAKGFEVSDNRHNLNLSTRLLFLGGVPTSICHFFRLSIRPSRTIFQGPYTM